MDNHSNQIEMINKIEVNNNDIKEDYKEENKFTIVSGLFKVNNIEEKFYEGKIKIDENKNSIKSYSEIITEIKRIKDESGKYLQRLMESNENLGATLSKVKEVEEEP